MSAKTYYNSKERYVLSEDKEASIELFSSSYEKLCYKILYLQTYVENSCDQQKELLDKLEGKNLYGYTDFFNTLKTRYYLLLQGTNSSLLPEVSEFLIKKCNIMYKAVTPTISSKEVENKEHGKSSISNEEIEARFEKEKNKKNYTKPHIYHLIQTINSNPDKTKLAKYLIDHADRKGLPGIVDTFLVYISTIDIKKTSLPFNLLSADDMDELRTRVKAAYQYDLFQNSSFLEEYMERFGTVESDDSDPKVRELTEATLKRRIQFLRKNQLSGVLSELKALLTIQSKRGYYDKVEFIEYLKRQEKGEKKYISSFSKEFLEALFPEENPEQFTPYLVADEVMRIYEKSLLLRGDSIKPKHLTVHEVADLEKEMRCRLLSTNPLFYNVGDRVELKVELKNVPHLDIHIFEVNTLAYYQKNQSDIDASIDVDGMVPCYKESHEYSLHPIQRHIETFSFPTIQQRGVYVIDFIANHTNCRFLLHMGCLNVLTRPCLSGYAITVVDEKGSLVEENVKILMEEREFKLNENKEIIIPYLPKNDSKRRIPFMVCQSFDENWCFASRHSMEVKPETIRLFISCDLDNEANVPGNEECTMLLRVVADVNNCELPSSMLEDLTVTLRFTDIHDIQSEKVLHPKLDDKRCFTYSFRVQEGYKGIWAYATAKVVFNTNKEEMICSSSSTAFSTQSNSKSNTIKEIDKTLHLFRKMKEGRLVYVLQVSGPANECLAHQPVDVEIQHVYFVDTISIQMETDANGQIHLDTLDKVKSIKVNDEYFTIVSNQFKIQERWNTVDCDPIQAQFPVTENDVQNYHLVPESCKQEFSSIHPVIGYVGNYLRISHLPAGSYKFYLYLKNWKTYAISITVDYSSIPPVVHNRHLYYGNGALFIDNNPLSLHCSIESNSLLVSVHGGTGDSSVHVLYKTFAESQVMPDYLKIDDLSSPSYAYTIAHPSSVIALDRTFSDEFVYIMERQKQKRELPGSMLPAPGLLLHPIENDETTTKNIEGDNGRGFGSKDAMGRRRCMKACPACSSSGGGLPLRKDAVNAIENPSMLVSNIPIDSNGNGVVELPVFTGCGYEVLVVCEDAYEVVDYHLYYDQEAQEKTVKQLLKRQELQEGLDCSKHYTEELNICTVPKGQPFELETKRDMVVFTSLEDVWSLLKTLSKNTTLQDFAFLLKWDSLSFEEKKVYYNRYNCSEINVFVYFKDSEFFNLVVKPHLQSKIEKSFLDHFMVDDDVSMYLLPSRYDRLNAFEKALLSSRLPAETAEKMINGMKNTAEFRKLSQKERSRISETALKLKSMNQKEDTNEEEPESEEDTICQEENTASEAESVSPVYFPMAPSYMPMSHRNNFGPGEESRVMACMVMPRNCLMREEICGDALPMASSDVAVFKARRADKVEKFYEKMEKTKEYVEGYYYQSKSMYSSPSNVPISPFWSAFAEFLSHPTESFLSSDFIYCTHSFSEVIFCLSVLGLPYSEVPYVIHTKKNHYELCSETPMILFQKVIKESPNVKADDSLMIIQKYIDCNNSTENHNGKKIERYMQSNEFLCGQPYMCKVFMTNLSAMEIVTSVLYQIPTGSYPLLSPFSSHVESVTIPPFTTRTFQYTFYFPVVGEFNHFPAHLIDPTSTIIGYAAPSFLPLHVVDHIETVDVSSWRDVAFTADEAIVFQYLSSHDITSVDWDLLLWRLNKKDFFLKLIAFLRTFGYFNSLLWKYSLKHQDVRSTTEYISKHLAKEVGLFFDSPMLTVHPDEEDLFRIREYKPYINNRCLMLGKKMKIANDKLEKQYERFLEYLTMKKPTTDDYALLTYYLILQDRIQDALNVFKTKVCDEVEGRMVRKPDCTCVIQCDYMIAYFDCFNEGLSQARLICKQYADYPVVYWRELFNAIADLIKDYDSIPILDDSEPQDPQNIPENTIRSKQAACARDCSLTMEVREEKVIITTRNIPSVSIHLYELNVELMFSKNPFMQNAESTSLVTRPNYAEVLQLGEVEGICTTEYVIPTAYQTKNLLVEVCHSNLHETAFAFNNRLLVLLATRSGQLRVYDKITQKPLASCYVKVYAKTSKGVEFLKDGYTDIRGYFDYYSVSTDVGDRSTKLSLFIDKEGFGSCIREVNPPASSSK